MPRKSSSTASTGGKGYTFADKVAAGFLVQMLARTFPLGKQFGFISQLHFETKESGRSLDDLFLVLNGAGKSYRWPVSVKSNRQLSKEGFHAEFAQDAWADWKGEGGADFDQDSDLLGLVVGKVGNGPLQDWEDLREEAAATTPDRFVQRLDNANKISLRKKKIFASLYPAEHPDQAQREDTARLSGRIHVLHFNEKRDEGHYIGQCANLVFSGRIEEGTKLWDALCQLAAENRGSGGYFDPPKLLRHVRGTFDLVDYPDFKTDWDRLDGLTADNLANVRSFLGDNIRLDRSDEAVEIVKNLEAHAATVVAGESGVGKSALVAKLAQEPRRFGHVIWLTSTQLSRSSQNEILSSNGLRHTVPDLIASSSRNTSLLVIDAFEKFEGDALLRVGELLRAVRDTNFTGWKVIISGHLQSWEKAQRVLFEQGVTDVVKIELEPPSLSKIRSVVQELPGIGTLFLRAELQPILRNLMVLDWVLRTNISQGLSQDPKRRIGETDLINSIWDHWISRSRRLERDRLLRKLGEHEGERLSGAVSVDSVDQTELQLLEDMSREDLVRIELPSVRFTHDLIGDWARFRALVGQSQGAVARIKSLIQIPRWNRAIRLYAQSLVEGREDLVDWQKALAELDAPDPESKLAKDLFLEALIFAANSASLLEAVWPNLIADKGKLLNRLMERLLLVATFPDPRLCAVVPEEDRDASESWFRIPLPIYWIPVLFIFSAHANDIASVAFKEGAEVCALYLRNMPADMPGRKQAAQLALVLARELQDRVAAWPFAGQKGKVVYEALLFGAAEEPDAVAQVALEIAGRRSEPDHAIERRKREQIEAAEREKRWREEHPERNERQRTSSTSLPGVSYSLRSRRAAPIPEGPQRRVPEGFREAVMDWGALSELITQRPATAKEILLAVCLEDPGQREPEGIFHSFGLARWHNGYPPIYFKGPFLTFLQRSSQVGLETIVKLSNIVADEWLRVGGISKLGALEQERYALKLRVDAKKVLWFGNGNVYNLHRDGRLEDNTMACALMALEKWFYDELAAGHNIDSFIQYIYENANSLAFAGVLVSVGLYRPALFHGCLRPLLGNIHIYDCQSGAALSENFEGWSIGLAGRPKQEIQLSIAWNRMPHRRALLQDLVPRLLFEDASTQAYLKESATEWGKKQTPVTEEEKEKLRLFLARFQPESYQLVSHQDNMIEIRPTLPQEIEQKRQVSQAESEFRLLVHGMALRARRLLDGRESLSEDQLAEFFHQLQRLAQPAYGDLKQSEARLRLESVAGGLAVLFINHRSWLSKNEESERWCFDVLENLREIDGGEHEGPESGNRGINVETFLGEIGVFLLQERHDEWIKRIAFEGVTGFYYASTLFTMWRAHLCRERLSQTFDDLIHGFLFWSAIRRSVTRKLGYHSQKSALPECRATLYARFLNGTISRRPVTVKMAAKLGGYLVERIERKDPLSIARREWETQRKAMDRKERDVSRDMAHLDYEVLQNGFCFLSSEMTSEKASDRRRAEEYVRQLFDLEMETLPILENDDEGREIGGTAFPFDVWVMQRVAELLATLNSREAARAFYEPVLRRGPAAKYWTQDFLEAWIMVTLPRIAQRSIFADIWRDMVDYAFSRPAWIGRKRGVWYHAETLSVDLMGLREPAVEVLGRKEYLDLVKEMAPTFKLWADQWLKYASVATWFSNFLSTESGQALLSQGIQQLSPIISSFDESDWERGQLASSLTAALAAAWKRMPTKIAEDAPFRHAFLHILTELCSRSVAEAVHLRDRVAQIITVN